MDLVSIVADKGDSPTGGWLREPLALQYDQQANPLLADLFVRSVPQQIPIWDSATRVASSVGNDSFV